MHDEDLDQKSEQFDEVHHIHQTTQKVHKKISGNYNVYQETNYVYSHNKNFLVLLKV